MITIAGFIGKKKTNFVRFWKYQFRFCSIWKVELIVPSLMMSAGIEKKASRNGRNSICRAKKFNSRRTTKISLNSHFRFRPHSPNNDLILHRLLWKFYSAFQPKIMIKWLIYISHENFWNLYGRSNHEVNHPLFKPSEPKEDISGQSQLLTFSVK